MIIFEYIVKDKFFNNFFLSVYRHSVLVFKIVYEKRNWYYYIEFFLRYIFVNVYNYHNICINIITSDMYSKYITSNLKKSTFLNKYFNYIYIIYIMYIIIYI